MLLLLIVAMLLVPSIALAAAGSTDTVDGWLQAILDAGSASNWKAVVVLGLLGAVVGLRALADRQGWSSLSSGVGAIVIAAALGSLTTLSATAIAGQLTSFSMVIKALFEGIMLASSSSGVYSWWKTHSDSKKDV